MRPIGTSFCRRSPGNLGSTVPSHAALVAIFFSEFITGPAPAADTTAVAGPFVEGGDLLFCGSKFTFTRCSLQSLLLGYSASRVEEAFV